jgi:hypothetical protein
MLPHKRGSAVAHASAKLTLSAPRGCSLCSTFRELILTRRMRPRIGSNDCVLGWRRVRHPARRVRGVVVRRFQS